MFAFPQAKNGCRVLIASSGAHGQRRFIVELWYPAEPGGHSLTKTLQVVVQRMPDGTWAAIQLGETFPDVQQAVDAAEQRLLVTDASRRLRSAVP